MLARILGLVLCWLVWGGILPVAWGQEWGHSFPQWRSLGRGMGFAVVQVYLDGEVVEDLAVVKVDPANNAFRVFHHAPQNITAWQQEIKAPVVFNASYYTPQGNPVGLIMVDGKAMGPRQNRQMRGMFVAEPKGMSPDLPRATILDLVSGAVDPRKLPWTQGVQSFPLLLDYKGRIRVQSSEKTAHRTVIATDRNGNILVFNTGNAFFTLYDFAQFLKASSF